MSILQVKPDKYYELLKHPDSRSPFVPTQRPKLDEIDLRILRELQDHGRITNVELSKRVGISAPPCLRRVRALEDQGIIEGYHGRINGQALGYQVTVFAMVSLNSQAETDLVAFEERMAQFPMVRECHMLQGEIDFMLKIVAEDLASFQHFLTEKLTSAPMWKA